MRFSGKIALVTGGGRGIGRAIGLRLASEGADIVVNYFRNRHSAEETAEAIQQFGRRCLVVRANLADLKAIDRLFDTIQAEWDGLDFLISNAASGFNRPVMEQRPKGWEWTMNTNARALLFAAQRAAPLMQARGGGCIVAISSPGARRVLPEYVVVGASKAAIESLVRYLAVELAPMGIVVNAVSPGLVRTEALSHFSAARRPLVIEQAESDTPAGRLVAPQDVAALVAFLCSSEAMMIRGQTIEIDGGYALPVSVAPQG
jgi:enoyl-[acyl-carrier protein] reductase III